MNSRPFVFCAFAWRGRRRGHAVRECQWARAPACEAMAAVAARHLDVAVPRGGGAGVGGSATWRQSGSA